MLFSSKCLLAFLTFAASASSSPVALSNRDVPLSAVLTPNGGSMVKISVRNTANKDIKFLKYNTVFDTNPIQKVTVTGSGTNVPFTGIRVQIDLTSLPEEAFHTIKSGETQVVIVDVAQHHSIPFADSYQVSSKTPLFLADANSTALNGDHYYLQSNMVQVHVDDATAAASRADVPFGKRSVLTSCSADQQNDMIQALEDAANIANACQTDALNNNPIANARFQHYFNTLDGGVRQKVAAKFQAMVPEGNSVPSGGRISYNCNDPNNFCQPGYIAYTIVQNNAIYNCAAYYGNALTPPNNCNDLNNYNQATVSIHEYTHCPDIGNPGTSDITYGYDASIALSAADAQNNADNYRLYANAVNSGCQF